MILKKAKVMKSGQKIRKKWMCRWKQFVNDRPTIWWLHFLWDRKWDCAQKLAFLAKRKPTALFLFSFSSPGLFCCCKAKSSSYADVMPSTGCQCVHQCQCYGYVCTAKNSRAISHRSQPEDGWTQSPRRFYLPQLKWSSSSN